MEENALIVLIVDDNEAQRYALRRKLLAAGFQTQEAANGSEALAGAQALPDVVLLDINLPDLDGFEVCRRLKTNPRTAHIPVVQMSAYFTGEQHRFHGFDSGAEDYLVHPIAQEELTAKLMAWGRVRRAEAELRRVNKELEARVADLSFRSQLLAGAEALSHTGAWEWDLKTGHWTFSEEWRRIHGCAQVPLTAGDLLTIAHLDDRPAIARAFEDVRNGVSSYDIEHRIIRRDTGEIRIVRAHGQYVADPSGAVVRVYGFVQDITEQRGAEAAVRERQSALTAVSEQLKTIFDSVPATIWYKDTKNNFVRVNRAAAELAGKAPEEIEGRPAADIFPREADKYYADDLEVIESGKPKLGIVERVTAANGAIRWVQTDKVPITDAKGNLQGLVAFAADITERKRTEEALARLTAESDQRRRLYETVLSNTPDLIYVFDLNHRFTYANDSLLRMWGRTWDEAIGKNCLELGYEPWHAAMHDREIDEVIAAKRSIKGEVPFQGTQGRRIYEYIFVPVLGTDGRVEAVAGTTRDVTERRLAEQALRDSEERVSRKLLSILSPEGDLSELELADIIDAPALQALFEQFYEFARIPMAIIDLRGNVLVGVGWQDICTEFHRANAESCKHCIESDTELSAGVPAGKYKIYHCKNHMWDVATPIVIGGKHMGNLFTGQFFFDDETPDVELFRAQARRYGFNENAYLAALDRVPRLSRQHLASAMAYFMKLAGMISQLSYSNIKLARSLTERDALTEALRHSEQRFRTLSELVPQMIWTADDEGNIDYVNERWRSYTGQTAAEALGLGFFTVVHPDDVAERRERWIAAVHNGAPFEIESRLCGADGQYRWFLTRATPVQDAQGRVQRWFGTCTDIEDLKTAHHALIRNEKLASVGRMAATIAHEINNPLSASMNSLFLAEMDPALPATARHYLKLAEKELDRVAHITKQTLGFYRESGAAVPVHLPEVLDGVLDLYGPKLRNKAVFVVREYRASPPVRGIEGELRQVIANLVANSIDALEQNGTLRLRVSPANDAQADPMVRLTIADTGGGIAPQDLRRIFEPFFTTKQAFGTGLGLWVSRELINKHDGRICVRSRVGKGTAFSIWLPAERRSVPRDGDSADDA